MKHSRWIVVVALAFAGASLRAAVLGSGTLSVANPHIVYNGGPLLVDQGGSTCPNDTTQADRYDLTTDLPADFGGKVYSIRIETSAVQSGDMVLHLKDASNNSIRASDGGFVNGTEMLSVAANPGMTTYHVWTCLFAGSAATYTVTVDLQIADAPTGGGPGPCDASVFGAADPTCTGNPRYQIFVPNGPGADSAKSSSGEYNIGFNRHSGRIMNMNIGPVLRITPAEIKPDGTNAPSGLPEACPELWEDVSAGVTDTGVDPILFTDYETGRTFASNSTVGANADYSYTDDDGALWVPVGAGPPNFGADHQTIGTGPLPAAFSGLTTPENHGRYGLYCSQNLVGAACQRSLTLGTSWENGQIATGPGAQNSQGCGGLHGHVRIAPDGTAWLPDKSCGGLQGGAISIDTGTTPWTEFSVQKKTADADGPAFASAPQTDGADPSIGLDENSTAYYCYVNNEAGGQEGHVHVAVGKRRPGTTIIDWIRDTDVGKSHGIVNAAHTEAIAGSAGRAACGFLGTDQPGNYEAGTAPGMNWYLFIATTYDEGRTWTTVNATPNDPVQHNTGIWQQGGSGQNGNRNLLDFNEITLDDKGRVLYGYSDGCVSPGCISGSQASNDKTADMRVARQIGGRSLLAQFDNDNDTNDGIGDGGPLNPKTVAPKRACLLDKALNHPTPSLRDASAAHLRWLAPDNGGAAIVNYDVYRGTTPGGPYTLIGTTPDAKPQYDDTTSGDTIPDLYYVVRANSNASLSSADSNEVHLPIETPTANENLCDFPGLTVVTDSIGTGGTAPASSAGPGMDLRSLQVSQPFASDGVAKLIFTINTDPGQSPQPAGSAWYASMKIDNGTTTRYKAVHMVWNGPTPTFESYTPSPNSGGTVDGRFVTAGSQKPAEANSSYAAPFNKVVIVVKASDLGLAPGDVISGFNGAVTVSTGGVITGTVDEMPGGLGYTGTFAVQSNQFCRPNQAPVVSSFTATPDAGDAPLTVTFNGTAYDPDTTPDPADTIANYHIDFGDGQSADLASAPVNFDHTYTTDREEAEFTAVMSVTDSRGLQSVTNGVARIAVANELTAALTATPTSIAKGETVALDASASRAPSGKTIVEYDFDPGDGSSVIAGSASSTSHAYMLSGTYTASVSVKDSSGKVSTTPATATISVSNTAPVASLMADPMRGAAPLTVNFDASGSSDADSSRTPDHVVRYDFLDFGDGSPAETTTAPAASHTYDQPGLYNVILRVYDEEGVPSSSDAMVQIEVPNTPPSAQLTATPDVVGKNRPVTLDASGSSDAEGPLLYQFDFGDGSPVIGGGASRVTHAYDHAGSYTATVTVVDYDGAQATASASVTVTNSPPVAVLDATATTVKPSETLNLLGGASHDPDTGDSIQSYTFTFGDGTPPVTQSTSSVLHAYTDAGDYVATLIVTDRDGAVSDRATLPIKVSAGDNTSVLGTGAQSPWTLAFLGLLWLMRRARGSRPV